MNRGRRVALVALASLLAACGGKDPSSLRVRGLPSTPSPAVTLPPSLPVSPPVPTLSPPVGLSAVRVRLVEIGRFSQPLGMEAPAGTDDLYVVEKTGRIRAIRAGKVDPAPVLDVSGEISNGGEQGLLGATISSDRAWLYVNFTNRDGDTRVREYRFSGGRADAGSARDVLAVDQPYSNHNGGEVTFGPDGKLWIGLGDGGSGGDPHEHGQNLGVLLGKLLRIDPRPRGDRAYGIPSDNPFVGREGARGEIWAYGLRNPWRFSFDRVTRDLWVADVGQDAWEEVNWRPAASSGGENYGWNRMEGKHPYEGRNAPAGHVPPVYEYSHEGGNCSVTGGHAYRGTAIPALQGAYVFADFCVGRLRAVRLAGGNVVEHRFLGPDIGQVSAFGEDQSGELYVLSLGGPVHRLAPA